MIRRFISLVTLMTAAVSAQQLSVDQLHWLTGCWESPDGSYEEFWTRPKGGTLFGLSRTVKNDQTKAHEYLLIRQDSSGIYYVAHPSGQAQADFKLVSVSADQAVFENPEHDFPQRIIYRLDKDGSMTARIEGRWKGKERSSDFPMRRVKCP